jgi:hypothetical protein
MKYKIYVGNTLVKEYRYWLQAITYCLMNGYIYSGSGTDKWNFGYNVISLHPKVKIIKEGGIANG